MTLAPADLAMVPLGLLAGTLTTLAGLGGGLMLVSTLALLFDPHLALAVTAPALMIGNLHRSLLYRAHVDSRIAREVGLSGFAGALIFGWFALAIPAIGIQLLLLAATALALAKVLGFARFELPPRWLVPMGLVVGAVTATSGGGQALLAPTLLSAGLQGERYVSTAATCALLVHVGRVIAYGTGGLFDQATLARALALAACVLAGNFAGARLRPHLSIERLRALEVGTLLVVVAFVLAGVG